MSKADWLLIFDETSGYILRDIALEVQSSMIAVERVDVFSLNKCVDDAVKEFNDKAAAFQVAISELRKTLMLEIIAEERRSRASIIVISPPSPAPAMPPNGLFPWIDNTFALTDKEKK
jgi:hypothetical protein